jgi:diaminohydroxyphosphoribosylaminopyrimidine deaminase/5-amino-6-(5-phosphoribosylamino)uracil reductase
MSIDEKWMRRALLLAEKGRGRVHPNPMVGAVLVRGGRAVGEGYHRQYGQAHAEVEAIRRAGTRAAGSTLYVNLEPCSHWGKTPPCVEAITAAGIQRVVAAMQDPNPLVSGKGFALLKRRGISVQVGVLEQEAQYLNRAFITRMKLGRPYVTLKAAASLDGKTATVTGDSQWITGKGTRKAGHKLRAQVDAIAVGANTVLKDNPSLTSHGMGPNPVRIVFAGKHSIPRRLQIFNKAAKTWVLKNTQGKAGLQKTLKELAAKGVTHLLVEGGQTLQSSFLEANAVDEVVWFVAPLLIGNAKRLKDAQPLGDFQVEKIGQDLRISACLPESFRRSAK